MVAITSFICAVLLTIDVVVGFHSPPTIGRSFVRLQVSTDDIVTYEAIKQQARGALASGDSPPQIVAMMKDFLDEYASSNIEAGESPENFKNNIFTFMKTIQQAFSSPHQFQPFHVAIREPFDYYTWGNDFLRPLIIKDQSRFIGKSNADEITALLEKGENVVILSNHQTEADPQVISILLEQEGLAHLAQKIIFIAGHKVTSDPVCIPFSMGRNLICIHSKKHIKNTPEDIPRKQAQNLLSMKTMGDLVAGGGRLFWVAPSGGRDRPDESGSFVVSSFDAKALDMFKLLAMQSQKPMSFFPMAMYTHQLVPPPKEVSSTLGEERSAKRGAVSIHLLDKTDGLGGLKDKEFTAELQSNVVKAYNDLVAWHATFNS